MSDGTKIEWTDATWNPIVGCSVVSPGCTNCYAMRLSGTRMRSHPSRAGLTQDSKAGPVWTGEVRFMEQWLKQPLRWQKPRMIFVCAHADLFHESVPDEWIDRVFAVMALAPQHTFQVLTKRPERMRSYFRGGRPPVFRWLDAARELQPPPPGHGMIIHTQNGGSLPNAWLGVSVEDQRRADERVDILRETPAAVRWVSAEPMLGQIEFDIDQLQAIDWIVAGGESGPNARPMHPDWARSLRDQCPSAGVPFLFKQWGEWVSVLDRDRDDPDWRADYPKHERIGNRVLNLAGGSGFHGERVQIMQRVGKKAAGRLLDGVLHDGYPGAA